MAELTIERQRLQDKLQASNETNQVITTKLYEKSLTIYGFIFKLLFKNLR